MHPPTMTSLTRLSRLIGQPDAPVVINVSPLRWAIKRVAAMWSASRERRMLAELDDRMLEDIGISRAQAQFIASRREFRDWPRD
jgi:uncharacterized protein YjiS (DUF1127 family)